MAGVSTDTVPAMLTPGEFVIKRESAAMLGEPFLRKLNAVSDNATQGFHAGGGVNQNNRPHSNIDSLIGQAQENMKPLYGGGVDYVKDLALIAKEKREENPLFGLNMFTGVDPFDIYSVFAEKKRQEDLPMVDMEAVLENIRALKGHHDRGGAYDTDTGTLLRGYRQGGDVELYPEPGKPGRYKDPIHRYLSDMILAGKADEMGQLLNDSYYRQLVEQEMKFMQIQNLVQSAEEALPTYTGKKEGIDFGDIFGEQSWLKQRGKKKSIRNVEDIMGEMPFGQRRSELFEKGLYGLGYQKGGGVGEAGRAYPPDTLMSPFWGDTAPAPEAQDATATTPFQSLVQAAEFDKMVKMLMAQAALQKAKQANEVGEAEKIEWDGKSVLPPWEGKRNFKGNLYEDNIEFPVYREGNPQIYLQ